MKKIINNIRKQPESVRRRILHTMIAVFAFILILLWIYFLGNNLENPDTQAKMSHDLKPFSELKNNLVGGYQNSFQQ
ncbi:MAG: hypothetical protein WAN61_03595 [Minisyncoccia bacterium]